MSSRTQIPQQQKPVSLPGKPPQGTSSGVMPGSSSIVIKSKFMWRYPRTLKSQFILLGGLIIIVSLIQAGSLGISFFSGYNDFQIIAVNSVPSIDAAQAMAQYVADIDAKSADYLATGSLSNTVTCTFEGQNFGQFTVHQCDSRIIDAESIAFNKQVYLAAHNVTYEGERTAVERVMAGFEEYNGDISVMRREYGLATSKSDPTDPHLQSAYKFYQAATVVLHDKINMPAVISETIPTCRLNQVSTTTWPQDKGIADNIECLTQINYNALNNAYNHSTGFFSMSYGLSIVTGFLFCGLLIFTGLRMSRVTHRVINIGLTLALIFGVGYSIFAVSRFESIKYINESTGHHGSFGRLVEDDYNSIYYAAVLERISTDANADESRWLIARWFNDTSGVNHWQRDWENNIKSVESYIKLARQNQTYSGEIEPLNDMDKSWLGYTNIDGEIRSMANSGNISEAERISTGRSNDTFASYLDAVMRLSKVNRDDYLQTYDNAENSLNRDRFLTIILFPLVGLAAVQGIYLRLRDF